MKSLRSALVSLLALIFFLFLCGQALAQEVEGSRTKKSTSAKEEVEILKPLFLP